jgi:hypothetical protein
MSKNEHITIAKACWGILGITSIQLISYITDNKKINIWENVTLPTFTQVIIPTIGSKSMKGIIQKIKKFLGRIYAY